jgi:hypothetical protein
MKKTRKRRATGKSRKTATKKKATRKGSIKKTAGLKKTRIKRIIESIKSSARQLEKETGR